MFSESITGCVRSHNGRLYHVQVGATPLHRCFDGDSEISWNLQGPPGPSGSGAPLDCVGCSTEVGSGSTGVGGFGGICRDEFGPGARMCKSTEILDSTTLPDSGALMRCWVRPVFQPLARDAGTDPEPVVLDASGQDNFTSPGLTRGSLSCSGWASSKNTLEGLLVNPSFTNQLHPCDLASSRTDGGANTYTPTPRSPGHPCPGRLL